MSRLLFASTVAMLMLLCLAFTSMTAAHSWIDCTDYTEKNGAYSCASKCRARPRNWAAHTAINSAFEGDIGYNQQSETCKYVLSNSNYASFYTSAYPMATYRPGQEVCLAWPAKNHVAASCTNPYILDTSNKIYISGVNPTNDPSTNNWQLLADWGNNVSPATLENGGGKAFQNCPKFCENMDKVLCTGCFTIPTNLPEGRYAFQWRWVFNAGSPPYTTCWDAQVTSTGTPVTPTPSSGTQKPPSNNNNNSPLVGNAVHIVSPPSRLGLSTKNIPVGVDYSASVIVDIVVDLLSVPDYKWFSKAIQKNVSPGSGTLNLIIQVQNSPTELIQQSSYVIKPWIVTAGKGEANQGWTEEFDRKEYSLVLSDRAAVSGSSKNLGSLFMSTIGLLMVAVSMIVVV
ncbi:hypothetical protein FDP41_001111 [Naegleria fowleri]|uniref:Chitin-binding type-4 domain-containing protein n=1 Tax=Naegleria fowleri TaxID=5763 RepID=A0A6A5C236_NAEFO|nr:uncharacterized protein FDP41_001111 [Naegleria fowleri]KAF0979958.1 hypothetical protein FDP41_001111 [Naegleria fowleri]